MVATQLSAQSSDWWRGAVIYQIYPRSFADQSGDGVGDLRGIADHLEHVAALGVDAIWLSPVFASPMKDFGYDVSNYCDIDPLFGSLEDFDQLVDKAHRLGLRVMIDQVISHTSDQHPWFAESRQSRANARADWYVWADPRPDGTPPNNWLSVFGGSAWAWDPRRSQYYLHNFLASQPDLNFHTPAVQDAVLDAMRFWLERGVDGFRLDTVNYYLHSQGLENNPPLPDAEKNATVAPDVNPYNYQRHLYDKSQPENLAFIERLRALMDAFPGATTVGEVGDAQRQIELMAEYTRGSKRLHMAYTFDFLGGDWSARWFRDMIGMVTEASAKSWPSIAFSNHDVPRHASRWGGPDGDDALSKCAAAILLSLRCSPCLYQGEELGLPEAELAFEDIVDPYGIEFWPNFKGRDGCRTPMVWQADAPNGGFSTAPKTWLPVPAAHLPRAVDRQAADPASVLHAYQALLAFRRGEPALQTGGLTLVEAGHADILAYWRGAGAGRILCVFNLSAEPAKAQLPEPGLEPLTVPGTGLPAHPIGAALSLPAYGVWFGKAH